MLHKILLPIALATGLALPAAAQAHDAKAGDLDIVHPFATPSLLGSRNGAAYVVRIENQGDKADRLLKASSPVAQRVELHTMAVDASGVMRMREVDAIPLPAKSSLEMRPGTGFHIMLIDLKQPLADGNSFAMTLEFERAGKVEVKVVVQAPKSKAEEPAMH
jgi:copper(I)-binding protein